MICKFNMQSTKLGFSLNDYGLLDVRIGALLPRLDVDARLKKALSEFLEHYREFYQRINIIVDAMGAEDILIADKPREVEQERISPYRS
ncbi:hypothetical protein ACD661_06730 [Legionella lytica]|uniref:Uncharacterized protein n=1 Tax=Legionella lytica TaxID=96232 RepID=A0ABW8DAC7_9GAMM